MRNRTLIAGFILIVAAAWCMNAYAADAGGTNAWQGFWNSFGGFVYNAMPWNWGNWWGK